MFSDPSINATAYAGIEAALNGLIRLDDKLIERLSKLNAKVLNFQCHNPDIAIYIDIDTKRVSNNKSQPIKLIQFADSSDISVNGSLSAWRDFLTAKDKTAALINSDLSVTGDSQLLIELSQIATTLDFDWEYHLSDIIGDVPAALAGRGIKSLTSLIRSATEDIRQEVVDYLDSDRSPVAKREQFDQVRTQLRQAEMRLERLQAKLKKRSS